MGSEGKSRKRRSSPSPSPSPSSEDKEERSRKQRKREERERKSRRDVDDDDEMETKKRKKKEKKKSEESRKHSRTREGKDKKSKEKHKHKRKYLGPIVELSKDDYFSKNNEFSTWLKEEKGKYFSDLSSEVARDLFSSFIREWNGQKLKAEYYEGGIASAPRTTHNWKIRQEKVG